MKKKITQEMLVRRLADLAERMTYFQVVGPHLTDIKKVTIRQGLPGVQYRRINRPVAWRWYE